MLAFANVVVYNYQYMLDPKVRKEHVKDLPSHANDQFLPVQWCMEEQLQRLVCFCVSYQSNKLVLSVTRHSMAGMLFHLWFQAISKPA